MDSSQPIQEAAFNVVGILPIMWAILIIGGLAFAYASFRIAQPRKHENSDATPTPSRPVIRVGCIIMAILGLNFGIFGLTTHPSEPDFNPTRLHDSLYLVSDWDPDGETLPVCKKNVPTGSSTVTFRYPTNPEPHPGIVSWNVEDNLCTVTLTAEGETK